jgi:hypothetical protein
MAMACSTYTYELINRKVIIVNKTPCVNVCVSGCAPTFANVPVRFLFLFFQILSYFLFKIWFQHFL